MPGHGHHRNQGRRRPLLDRSAVPLDERVEALLARRTPAEKPMAYHLS
ncbi:hypothetical protein F0344_32500 [Streptomyces finlayi]|uniref:Uncharacterized protein n=1 Tax=Streptomyces finlayi TaxID=67296 RepID=A0A7G7BTM7_9ACTN|nr:hypothetical protein [Streptomyces finlayi]QNE78692.1 hypothetical protein F0344_32500 [Streptomyces finlayi]